MFRNLFQENERYSREEFIYAMFFYVLPPDNPLQTTAREKIMNKWTFDLIPYGRSSV